MDLARRNHIGPPPCVVDQLAQDDTVAEGIAEAVRGYGHTPEKILIPGEG